MGGGILEPRQVAFLEAIKASPLAARFYLSGGTALAAFYLHHRRSEDLDFFNEDEVDAMAIEVFLKSHKEDLGFARIEYQQSFNRNLFFLRYEDGDILKTEFTYYPFTRLEKGMRDGGLQIDSLRDIAVNKVFTILQQTRARDFIDLFFILQREPWTVAELLKDARIKFDAHIDPLQFGSQLLKVRDAKDMPRMLVPFQKTNMEVFFSGLAATLKSDILQ